jgi:hypothetical protein
MVLSFHCVCVTSVSVVVSSVFAFYLLVFLCVSDCRNILITFSVHEKLKSLRLTFFPEM